VLADSVPARPAPTRQALEQLVDPPRRLALERRRDVAVGVERGRDLGVPEPLLHDLRVDAGGEQEARVGVAKVVEAHPREPGPLDQRVEPAAEQVALEDWPAPGGREHQRRGEGEGAQPPPVV
jgi:hypothetical protein